MESPAAPAAQLAQQPTRGVPATRHYPRIFRFPVVRQLIRFTGVGVICTATSLALYALLRQWIDPQLANAAALILHRS